MGKTVIILPGWYQTPEDNWYPWLKSEAEKLGLTVVIPDLPTLRTDIPDMDKMLASLLFSGSVTRDAVIVGHSLGCLLALRIAERLVYQKMILVAGWDFNDLTSGHRSFWKSPIDHGKISRNVQKIYCVSSDNDPYFTAFQVEEMSKRLKGTYVLVKNAGHFTSKYGVTEIPEVLACICK